MTIALPNNQLLFSTVLSNIEDAVIAVDNDGVIIFMNKVAEQLTGWEERTGHGRTVEEVFICAETETKNTLENPVRTALASGHVISSPLHTILFNKDKTALPIAYRAAPILDHRRNIQGVVLVFRDKIEHLKFEEELKTVRKELQAFSHTISHDMRAPVRAINGYATILEEDYAELLGKEGGVVLNTIHKNALKLSTMIDRLLEFSTLRKEKIIQLKVDVRNEVATILRDLMASTEHHVDIILQDLPPLLVDKNMFGYVWTHLLSNAIKFSARVEKPKIEIGYQVEPSEVIYFVKDNGVGYDMQYADHLFGVFQRLHKVSEFEGIGIGLAMVHRIITLHGGRVWAEGKVDAGATFYFAMPRISVVVP